MFNFKRSIYVFSRQNYEELINFGASVIKPNFNIDFILDNFTEESKYNMKIINKVNNYHQNFSQKQSFNNLFFIKSFAKNIENSLNFGLKNILKNLQKFSADSAILQKYFYVKGMKYAIAPHLDQRGFVNLIAIILIRGSSNFYIFKNKQDKKGKFVRASKGDLILMRGYNFANLKDRPVHAVKNSKSINNRLSLTFRQITKDKEHLNNLKKRF